MIGTFGAGLSAAGRAIPAALLAVLPGLVFAAGYDHLAYGLGLLAGVVLAGLLIAPRLKRAEIGTIPSALGERFGSVAGAIAVMLVAIVALPLLVAELTLIGFVSEHALGIAAPWAVPAVLALAIAGAAVPSPRPLTFLSALAWLLIALGLLVPLTLIAFQLEGSATFPLTAYGRLLPDLQRMEEALIERGLIDFDTFSAHAAPFIRLMERDVLALVLTLALGVATLPHLASVISQRGRLGATRLAGAWTALFVMILPVSVPALAVYVKHALFTVIERGTPLASLPQWLKAPTAAGLVHIHGISLHLFESVAAAVEAGARNAAEVADALGASAAAASWQALDADIQQVMYASAAHHLIDPEAAPAWEIYRSTVLPAAAAGAGNDGAVLTQAGLEVEPLGFLFMLPELTAFPRAISFLLVAAGMVAALAVAGSLIRAVACVADRGRGRGPSLSSIALAFAVAVIACGIAVLGRVDPVLWIVSALAIGAAGLFPALAVGLAWRRATAAGVVSAMIVGAGVTGYYMAGTQLFPAAFYETWSAFSSAGEYAIEEFETLAINAREAATDAERRQAAAALDELARGSATRAGLANWGGIESMSSGIFGALAGLLVLIVVSLVTPSRRERDQA